MLNFPLNTTPTTPVRDIPRPSGFTLIEVLVTLVILSIGLLGLAGLQISGLHANMDSEQQSKATMMADDIIERMRANPLGVIAGSYAVVDSATQDCNRNPPAPFCSNFNSGGGAQDATDCTPMQMAAFDAWIWTCGMPVASGVQRNGVKNQLNSGTATIQCTDANGADGDPCSPGSSYTISVNWTGRMLNQGALADANGDGTVDANEQMARNITVSVIP
ncbi:MAG: type IV pilus modification protein PilV [Gammaproteobacteria bacterium]|nr:type IV pilus modification protein PilV [Gammaproteobacteria bacterium]